MSKQIAAVPLQDELANKFKEAIDQVPEQKDLLSYLWQEVNRTIEEAPQTNNEGHWVMHSYLNKAQIICECCGRAIAPKFRWIMGNPTYDLPKYCPECGAAMNNQESMYQNVKEERSDTEEQDQ